ncbi:MAG: hypothetical protein QOK02_839 [Mycobacterium sp.]|nr:hypothetical protein [Mycobacterium sp.]
MGDGLKVDTADLRAKARQVENVHFADPAGLEADIQAPDSLPHTKRTMEHLAANARYLADNQAFAKTEQQRLADTLNSVAKAYDEYDAAARQSLDTGAPAPGPVTPAGSGTPEPKAPSPLASPSRSSSGGYVFIDLAQDALGSGDHGASLTDARNRWDANGVDLQRAGATFIAPIVNWEGAAADEAYGKFFDYGNWITQLGQKWQALAREAQKIVDAHLDAVGKHNPVYTQYKALEANIANATQSDMDTMAALVKQSEDIQDEYTVAAAVDRVTVDRPPPPVGTPSAPVTTNGDPRQLPSDWKDNHPPQGTETPAASGGAGGGGGGQPIGGTPSTPQTPSTSVSPMSAEQASKESPSGAGPGSGGGSPSGGSGSSSGSGSPTGGAPSLPGGGSQDMTPLSDDPSLHPAAADAGGAGGGSGGGAGGGSGPIPLQPNVGGVSVGPGPGGAGGAGAAPAASSGAGGAMGGGVGVPPGGQAQSGKEKRRTPSLSPDESLYVEDREYTEEVIGARKRRTIQDPKAST